MKRRFVLVTVVFGLFLALAGILVGGNVLSGSDKGLAPEQSGMPVPGPEGEGIEESIIEDGDQGDVSLDMPVPGREGLPEMIVDEEATSGAAGSGMPVPGLPGIEESIVTKE